MADTQMNGGDAEKPAFADTKLLETESRVPVTESKSSPRTLREKLINIKNNITVEPTLAFYIMPSVLAMLATQNLNLEKACRVNLAYSNEVCDALSARDTQNYTKEEAEVQQLVAQLTGWKTFIQSSVPACLILFLGSWTDRKGRRKPCIVLPIIGEFLTCVGLLICTYFFHELPMEVAGLIQAIFPAMTGGWYTMYMGIFSYVGNVSSVENRTLRMGLINIVCSLGYPIGTALSGILYEKIGFYGVFSLSSTMYLISIWYAVIYIKECPRKEIQEATAAAANNAKQTSSITRCLDSVRDFFDFGHVRETFRVALKKGERNRRKRVILLMVVVMLVIGPNQGEFAIEYLFLRYRFNWNEVDYSIFSTYGMVINLIGTSVVVGFFSHFLKMDDAMIGVLAFLSKISSNFIYAFATTVWMLYVAPIVQLINSSSYIVMRSIGSKLVSPDELGQLNSLFGASEALMPLIYGPMYSYLYSATIHILPGAFYLLGGFLTFPAVVIFGWMYMVHRKERIQFEEEKNKNDV